MGMGNRSLNSGFVSFVHNGLRLKEEVTKFTLAHEIGHSFGSLVSSSKEKSHSLGVSNVLTGVWVAIIMDYLDVQQLCWC
jgi:hypothetical protein